MSKLVDVVHAYLRAIEQGDLPAVLRCYSPEAIQIEWPNRLKAKGDKRGIEQLAADFQKGKGLLLSQSYEVLNHAEGADYVTVEVLWRGKLAISVGTLPAGAEIVLHSSIAFNFQNDLIVSQRNYDCFEEY